METKLERSIFKKCPTVCRNLISINCDNGWYDIIYNACAKLEEIANKAAPKHNSKFKKYVFDFICRIQTRWYGLFVPEFLINYSAPPSDNRLYISSIKSDYGVLIIKIENDPISLEQNFPISSILYEAIEASKTCCEICGKKGRVTIHKDGMTTLCDFDWAQKFNQDSLIINALGSSALN